jgi:hypothetical protein
MKSTDHAGIAARLVAEAVAAGRLPERVRPETFAKVAAIVRPVLSERQDDHAELRIVEAVP